MGWSRGSELMTNVIEALIENVEDSEARAEIYRAIIPAFEDLDADTLDECVEDDKVFKKVFYELNPEYLEEQEDEDEDEEFWDE